MKAFLIGIIVLTVYNISLVVKNMLYYFRQQKYTELLMAILYLFLVPLIIYWAAMIPEGNLRIWAGTFAIIFGIYWLVFGIVMDAYRKSAEKGTRSEKGPRPSGWRILTLFIFSILVFYYGAFIGIEKEVVRNIILGADVLIFCSAVISFYKWWKY